MKALFVFMFFVIWAGYLLALYDIDRYSIEVHKFKKEWHSDFLASSFQFTLAPDETLYIEHFQRGDPQDSRRKMRYDMRLHIVVEGIKSPEDFLSRFNGEILFDLEMSNDHNYSTVWWYNPGTFRFCDLNLFPRSQYSRSKWQRLLFFQDENGIMGAKFEIHGLKSQELGETMTRMLFKYLPSIWIHPFFIVPVLIQVSLILFVVRRSVCSRRLKEW
ncbi:MAG: hypothetical protein FWG87_02050 [Defluviitaleaceae bacterium]|nr:hypothetical protein [Defluviitaleaceae bacterium]